MLESVETCRFAGRRVLKRPAGTRPVTIICKAQKNL